MHLVPCGSRRAIRSDARRDDNRPRDYPAHGASAGPCFRQPCHLTRKHSLACRRTQPISAGVLARIIHERRRQASSPRLAKTGFHPAAGEDRQDACPTTVPFEYSGPAARSARAPFQSRGSHGIQRATRPDRAVFVFAATSHGVVGDELLLEVAMATPVMIPPAARAGRIHGPIPPRGPQPSCARTT